ncbi:MAG: hypothetical protein J7K38_02250 [Thermoplasmata archaeon]|nr:hypothetical protein [Thermoplasmata archaeon]
MVYTPDLLEIDEEKFRQQIIDAVRNALTLAIDRKWATKETINYLISMAHQDALALSLSIGFPTKENMELLLRKAYIEALHLKNLVDKKS